MVAASRRTGIDAITDEGLIDALTRAGGVVDVANPPTFDDQPVMEFFTVSTTNLLAAAKDTGQAVIPYSIVRSTSLSTNSLVVP